MSRGRIEISYNVRTAVDAKHNFGCPGFRSILRIRPHGSGADIRDSRQLAADRPVHPSQRPARTPSLNSFEFSTGVPLPTFLRYGPYRMFTYSSDGDEPPHVHVARDHREAQFWMAPVRCAYNKGFSESELRRIHQIISKHRRLLMDAWNGCFGT